MVCIRENNRERKNKNKNKNIQFSTSIVQVLYIILYNNYKGKRGLSVLLFLYIDGKKNFRYL